MKAAVGVRIIFVCMVARIDCLRAKEDLQSRCNLTLHEKVQRLLNSAATRTSTSLGCTNVGLDIANDLCTNHGAAVVSAHHGTKLTNATGIVHGCKFKGLPTLNGSQQAEDVDRSITADVFSAARQSTSKCLLILDPQNPSRYPPPNGCTKSVPGELHDIIITKLTQAAEKQQKSFWRELPLDAVQYLQSRPNASSKGERWMQLETTFYPKATPDGILPTCTHMAIRAKDDQYCTYSVNFSSLGAITTFTVFAVDSSSVHVLAAARTVLLLGSILVLVLWA